MSETAHEKRSDLLITSLPQMVEVPGHHNPAPFYLTAGMFGGIGLDLAGGDISGLVGQEVADFHTHPVPEIYLLVAPNPGEAEISIFLERDRIEAAAPAAFYVPAGFRHKFVTRRASVGSYCFGILLHNELAPSGTGRPAV